MVYPHKWSPVSYRSIARQVSSLAKDRRYTQPVLVDTVLSVLRAKVVEEKLRRKLIIARLPNVERLNGSRVCVDERDTANRAFIRHYVNADTKPPR